MRVPALVLMPALALAQNSPHIRDWKPPVSEQPAPPRIPCAALHSLTGYEYSVLTAEEKSAGEAAFCRVRILVQPEILIEVALPARWNRRLYMFGNGGYAGEKLDAPNRVANRDTALQAGFTVTQTNTGHDAEREPLAAFTVHPQKFADYAFRSLHVTAETAKRVAEAYYGSRPMRSYYNGCSTGGRQGLILAQRYPDDFDGIVVGAPALDNVRNRLRSIANYQALAKAPLPAAKMELLAGRVYARCDAVDGLKDGLIDDPRKCDFKPSRDLPVCEGAEQPGCYTAGQIRTIETILSDVIVRGKVLTPGFPVGAEIAGPNGKSGWDGWIINDAGLPRGALYAESAMRYMVSAVPDPAYDLRSFDFERDPQRLEWIGTVMNATDPDLSRFRRRGGKLLMYFGWADPALNARIGVEYFESVQARMGKTGDFFKLYMMPGVFHCSGGVGPACFDPLEKVIRWVEEGKAPGSIVAQRIEGGKTLLSRPLCPYPQVARYQGSGPADQAASFRCVDP